MLRLRARGDSTQNESLLVNRGLRQGEGRRTLGRFGHRFARVLGTLLVSIFGQPAAASKKEGSFGGQRHESPLSPRAASGASRRLMPLRVGSERSPEVCAQEQPGVIAAASDPKLSFSAVCALLARATSGSP